IGGFALLVATSEALYAVRDPKGNRPLVLGKLKETNDYVFSSETCALNVIGAQSVREVEPGELIEITINSQYFSTFYVGEQTHKTCIFEYIYFSRPDSVVNRLSLYDYRQGLGRSLSNLDFLLPSDNLIVMGVPDSGTPAAIGYSNQSGFPYVKGLVKNKYINRTFIEPSQEMRDKKAILKYNLIPGSVKDKRVVLIDDSIVRGTTMTQLIKYLRKEGALEVHLRISSPPIRWECLYGIDTSNKELIAKDRTCEEIRQLLGADSLIYLSQADITKDIGYVDHFCMACFNGDYNI
ncbi:MAG: amidophosphoribosyltransferase, partial [Nitrososphaeraceae archaeon]|nr:amidophosphoribosyltransferase [Nitrososphaeraceae archaeon]